jgi:hypothetical protein
MIQIIDDLGSLHIILYSRSGYINDHISMNIPYLRIDMFNKIIHPFIL